MGYRDHSQTKDLVRRFSRLYNILKAISEAEGEHPSQERSVLILLWTYFRIIVARNHNKTFVETSSLASMASQDLCSLANIVRNSELSTNCKEIEQFCQSFDKQLLQTGKNKKRSSQYQCLLRMVQQNIKLNKFLPITQKKLKPEDYLHRQAVVQAQCLKTHKSYEQSYQPLTMLLAIKIGS